MIQRLLDCAFISLLLVTQAAAQHTAPPAIFSDIPPAPSGRVAGDLVAPPKSVADRQLVGMHLDRLFDRDTSRVLLNVEGRDWVAAIERLDADIHGYRAWVGAIEGIPYSHVSFAERNGVVSGLINGVAETFAVRTIVPGVYALDRMQASGGELEPVVPQAADMVAEGMPAPLTASDDGSVIDVLLLYTPGARLAVGGTGQITALLAQIISDTNTVFIRSGIATRVRLVGANEAPVQETADMSADLSALRSNAAVAAARNAAGADLVQLIQNSASTTSCGIGYLLNSTAVPNASFPAYSISDYSCVSGYTPTHEMGHNMGSHHAPEDGAAGALFPYSYGYKDAARGFRTVMAYSCTSVSCPRIANFSNPGVAHLAAPTGTVSQNNARSINEAAVAVANFRQALVTTVTPPSAPTGLTSQVSGLNATLSWNQVLADATLGTSAATGYILQVGSRSGVYDLLSVPTGPATTISGSAAAGSYFWRVLATNSAGTGAPSVEAQFTLGGCAPPGAPANFTHTIAPGGVVTLNWTPPPGSPLSYVVDVGSAPGWTNLLSAPVGPTTMVAVAAPAGTYYVRVRAVNGCAASSVPSNERTIVVP